MGKAPDPPQPTDPHQTSAAQTGTNVSTAIANAMMGNVNQVTAQGTLTYDQTGSYKWTDPYTKEEYTVPTFTATQKLSPAEQAKYDQRSAAESSLSGLAAQQSSFLKNYMEKPMSIDDMGATPTLGQMQTSYATPDTKEVQDALMARMQPSLDRDRTALETKLSNQGIKAGSGAWLDAMRAADQQTNDARMAAVINAGQEQSRLAGLNQSAASFANNATMNQFSSAMDARRQGLQERTTLRNQPINEITALLSGSQVSQPNWISTNMPKIANTDNAAIISNYDNQRMQAWQAENAQSQSLVGGLMGLGGKLASSFMMSDETMKTDKKEVGELKGHKLYEYHYKGEPKSKPKHIGVMAQQVEKKRPDAVRKGPDGKKRVNYGKLFLAGAKG